MYRLDLIQNFPIYINPIDTMHYPKHNQITPVTNEKGRNTWFEGYILTESHFEGSI